MTNALPPAPPLENEHVYRLVMQYQSPDEDGIICDISWEVWVRAGQLPVPRAGEKLLLDAGDGPSVGLVVDDVRHWLTGADPHARVYVYASPESDSDLHTMVALDQQQRAQQWLNQFPAVVADSLVIC
ncbi:MULTISPECIES: hypothetical protein [Nocardia]|uniref:hypothetical protein n=1 Tax=Nocardia TaxID=1817 RepID=UPI00245861C6|nr:MULTISPECIES: hypothetical protein [Nocardia]